MKSYSIYSLVPGFFCTAQCLWGSSMLSSILIYSPILLCCIHCKYTTLYPNLSILLLVDIWALSSWFLTVINKNMCSCACLLVDIFTYSCWVYTTRSGIARVLCRHVFSFNRYWQGIFQSGWTSSYSYQQCMGVSVFLYHQHLVLSVSSVLVILMKV